MEPELVAGNPVLDPLDPDLLDLDHRGQDLRLDQHRRHVDGEDRGEGECGEAPQLLINGVEGRGCRRGKEHHHERGGDHPERAVRV